MSGAAERNWNERALFFARALPRLSSVPSRYVERIATRAFRRNGFARCRAALSEKSD
jgi:hypothetical protein